MAQAARQRAQAQSQRPGFLFLSCPDSQILLEEVEARARAWAPQDGPFKRLCFWGDEPPDNSFWEALNLRDLFGSVRLVVVRQAHLWHADVWKLLDKMLARPLTGSFPIFSIHSISSGTAFITVVAISRTLLPPFRLLGLPERRLELFLLLRQHFLHVIMQFIVLHFQQLELPL